MTAYALKLIAIITMFLDHSGYLVYGYLSWMNFIGRIAFPIFAFQISQGYIHTHNLKKYFFRLIIFAFISQIPYTWFGYCFFSHISLNIIFTLILGLSSITIYEYIVSKGSAHSTDANYILKYKVLGFIIAIFIALFAEFFEFDYGFYGIAIIFLFYIFHNNKLYMNIAITFMTFIYYMPYFLSSNFGATFIGLFFCSLIPLIFINLYNGKKGKEHKMLFYIFYPVHLLLICLIHYFL